MDIQTVYHSADNVMRLDYQVAAPALAQDDGLLSSVLISLFTDRRADDDDTLPDGGSDRRGWWGDSFADDRGDQIGSRLWLLRREKASAEVLQRARQYATEALQWLVDDDVVKSVAVEAEWHRLDAGARTLALQVVLQHQAGNTIRYRFANFWGSINGA
ncbi:phage GP46 family protein [Stenotrophomonas sp. MMGLT7]|uniref:phage GP46 family protein n=1 Tax=Stenotrophomonas sp. MMGLT7 TaxID=2901227 RepID=UPI001E39F40B|nr:phage GP46 family protein [Stenotrophomonas sp. MMGLT7]MCD7099126.1 phage GP46 family protein [Stenotrophomonas sp. MMGLT7]